MKTGRYGREDSKMHPNARSVGLFEAGYTGASVKKIGRLLSLGRGRYQFEVASSIHNLGAPDLLGFGYSDDALRSAIQGDHLDDYDLCVLLTSVPIEDNFYTRDIGKKIIVCTSHEAEEFIDRSGRTLEEYFALSVCLELLSVEFQVATEASWEALFHPDVRGCPFDFMGVKSQLTAYLSRAALCDRCRGTLANANVNDSAMRFIETFLSEIRRPSFRKALRLCLSSPGLAFVFGGLVLALPVNVVSSLASVGSPPSSLQLHILLGLLVVALAFPLGVYSWLWIQHFRRTRVAA